MTHSFTIKASHPSLKGHFPNNPIVPGVVILDEVFNILQEAYPKLTVDKISMVKFTHTLLAEQKVDVEINEKSETSISFNCSHNNEKLVIGQLLMKTIS